MSMIYNGAHGITIGGKHTWRDFGLAPTSRPWVEPPGVKTEYVDVPGAHGSLDYTDILNGVKYENRTGSWEFIIDPERTVDNWSIVYNNLLAFLHGNKFNVILDDEPNYVYTGRIFVNKWKSDQQYSTVTLDYNFEPYKYPVGSTADIDWKWNDLFDNTIYYGTFLVQGSKKRNLINPNVEAVEVAVTCTSTVTVTLEDETVITIPAGTVPDALTLAPGDNKMTFAGNAEVTIDYSTGRIL